MAFGRRLPMRKNAWQRPQKEAHPTFLLAEVQRARIGRGSHRHCDADALARRSCRSLFAVPCPWTRRPSTSFLRHLRFRALFKVSLPPSRSHHFPPSHHFPAGALSQTFAPRFRRSQRESGSDLHAGAPVCPRKNDTRSRLTHPALLSDCSACVLRFNGAKLSPLLVLSSAQ